MGFAQARRAISLPRWREKQPVQQPPRENPDELQELTETFRVTVDRLSTLMREVDAAHERSLQAEIEKKEFYRQVLCAVTQGRFALVDRDEMPEIGELVADVPCAEGPEYAAARKTIREAAAAAGMSEERAGDLALAAGEAITNGMKHATGGRCRVYRAPNAILLRVDDRGAGIRTQDLPNVILTPGFSTKVSLGMGYSLMLELCDRLWLSTNCDGTVVQLEKCVEPVPEPESFPSWVLDRL